jgi:type III secretory pathway component EscT
VTIGWLIALLRAIPFALALPLPFVVARIALGLVLALCIPAPQIVDAQGMVLELARGLSLGLAIALPLWAARYAGSLVDASVSRRGRSSFAELSALLAWVIFGAAGGVTRLAVVYASSYARWPVGSAFASEAWLSAVQKTGIDWLAFVAQLALPTLFALALVEGVAALVARFEHGAGFEVGAPSLARALRPLLSLLMLAASIAIFVRGLAAAAAS